MAFPTTAVLDAFTRADSTGLSSANWSTDYDGQGRSSFDIVSNQAKAAAGGFSSNWWNVQQFGPNSEVFATLAALPAVQASRLQLLINNVGTATVQGYELNFDINDPTNIYIVKINGLVRTDILTITHGVTIANGDALGLELIGTTLTAYRKPSAGAWGSLGSVVDASYSGSAFLAMAAQNDTAVTWDDFGGGTVVAGGAVGSFRTDRIRSRRTSW